MDRRLLVLDAGGSVRQVNLQTRS